MVKICFVGLYDEKNLGDPIIGDCVEWMYAQALGAETLHSKRLTIDYLNYHPTTICRITNRLRRFARKPFYHFIHTIVSGEYTRYYAREIRGSQLIVVVGGGLIKYTTQYFGLGLQGLLKAAQKEQIPVVINAVGVEGYDEANSRCLELKRTLQLSALKRITTRDDLETLRNKYIGTTSNILCKLVSDAAVWAAETYDVEKKQSAATIGIGVCREDMLDAHGYGISASEFFTFYEQLVRRLTVEGHKVEIFTNGLPEDNITAFKLKKRLEETGCAITYKQPDSPKELVTIVSNYKGIVAARLHACIIAYSLNIPAVGIVWNDKLTFFGRNIGCEQYFIKPQDLTVDNVRGILSRALISQYDLSIRERFRMTIVSDIGETVSGLLKCR